MCLLLQLIFYILPFCQMSLPLSLSLALSLSLLFFHLYLFIILLSLYVAQFSLSFCCTFFSLSLFRWNIKTHSLSLSLVSYLFLSRYLYFLVPLFFSPSSPLSFSLTITHALVSFCFSLVVLVRDKFSFEWVYSQKLCVFFYCLHSKSILEKFFSCFVQKRFHKLYPL